MQWNFEHTIVVEAAASEAWRFWSHVENRAFDAAIEWVKLNGPFETGSVGWTKSHGQEPTSWALVDVRSGKGAVIEMKLQDSVARFAWDFEPVSRDRTHLHQQITLVGKAVASYSAEMRRAIEADFIEGMAKLAQEIERVGAQHQTDL